MRTYPQVAAAVAAALGATAAFAAPPSLSTAAAPYLSLYAAGSSAAKPAFTASIYSNLCVDPSKTNTLVVTSSPNGNFLAISCTPPSGTYGSLTLNGSQTVTIYYRTEGGSVVGALPIASETAINTLNLNDTANISYTAGSNTAVATVNGTSGTNGVNDSFTGAVVQHVVEYGLTDVEPGALTGNNYPSAYSSAAYGSATTAKMGGLTKNKLFQQVFGIFINTNSSAFTSAFKTSPSLSKETITNLLQGNITDWSKVQDINGNAVATTLPVIIANREQGSGSRTSADIYFTGDECVASATPILEGGALGDSFATGDVLTAANSNAGAITYASIDNNGAKANLQIVNINGITPSNLNAATGQYDFWFEATDVPNTGKYLGVNVLSTNQKNLYKFLESSMQAEGTAPHVVDILAIPGVGGNAASLPVSGTANGSPTIYINPYTRAGVSCNTPSSAL